MLNPGDRTLLLESLRPPDGYALDRAVGTSYSLDLLALLTAPLAFTFFDWEDREGRPTADPLALLEAVRRNAGKIVIFCQAGETKLPPPASALIAYLEQSVIRVNAPRKDGVFHPKVWCLRFVAENLPVRYRLLVLSRNLTFDRSWDTVLRLDGGLTDRQKGYAANRPLGEFIAELPKLAVAPVAAETAAAIAAMADEIRRVEFELPPDVDEIAFWPLGLSTRQQRPFDADARRLLMLAPFLSASLLDDFVDGLTGCVLISRPDQLAAMPRETLAKFEQVFAMDPAVEDWAEPGNEQAEPALAGLHAKLFVEDAGRRASLYTGSANATTAAFERNVEFLVELRGRKSVLGIDALLDPAKDGRSPFLSLLQRWNPPQDFKPTDDASQRALDWKLARARRALASAPMHLEATSNDATYRLTLVADAPFEVDADVNVKCWPAYLRAELGTEVSCRQGELARFEELPLAALNGFVACEVTTTVDGLAGASRFAFNLPLVGAPTDRLSRLLASILSDKDHVRRLLWLLLEGQHEAMLGAFGIEDEQASRQRAPDSYEGYPLFEQMVGALAEDQARLKDIGRLIRDLAQTTEGNSILPEGLLALWESLEVVMEQSDGRAGPT